MAFDGNGTFNQATTPVVSGTVISSTNYNSQNTDYNNGLSNVICRDGQSTILANLPMSGYRHTGVGNAVARSDYAAAGQVQDGAFIWCGTAGGTADALTLTPTPAITAYAAGQVFRFIAGAAPNTGATTVAVSGLTAKAIQSAGVALSAGAIVAGREYQILYDGTQFQLSAWAGGASAASESVAGIIEIATAAETTTGTDDTRTITPKKLTEWAPATATPDTAADKVLFLDDTDDKVKQGAFPSTGVIVDRAYAEYTTNADLSTAIPSDDTIPQNTEGTQILSVSITPKSATNRLGIRFQGQGSLGTAGNSIISAIFRDSGANAIDARTVTNAGSAYAQQMCNEIEVVAGSTSATTINVRVGPNTGTLRMNGFTSGRAFGGVSRATLIIEEITA
jgi:hypothetical protein